MNKTQVAVLFGLLGSIGFVTMSYWSKIESRNLDKHEMAALAANANLLIGDVPIVAPFVIVLNQRSIGASFTLNRQKTQIDWRRSRDGFRAAAANVANPFELEKIDLRVRALGWSEVSGYHGKLLCQRLARQWARSICFDLSAPLLQSLPYNQTITFADNRKLEEWANSHHFAGYKGTLGNRLQTINWQPGSTSVICEKELEGTRRSCTAAILIDKYLVAIWSVWDGKSENVEQMAKRQGAAILAWVKYGLGTTENFEKLQTLVSKLKRPNGR